MILLAVFALIALAGLIPVGIDASYAESVTVKLKVWFLPIMLIPKRKKEQRKKSVQKKEQPEKKQTEKRKIELSALLSYLNLAAELLGDLRRKIVLQYVSFHIIFGGDDPARRAVSYGRAWAIIGSVVPILEQIFEIRKREIEPLLSESAKRMTFDARAVCTVRIGTLFCIAIRAFFRYSKLKSTKKEGE